MAESLKITIELSLDGSFFASIAVVWYALYRRGSHKVIIRRVSSPKGDPLLFDDNPLYEAQARGFLSKRKIYDCGATVPDERVGFAPRMVAA